MSDTAWRLTPKGAIISKLIIVLKQYLLVPCPVVSAATDASLPPFIFLLAGKQFSAFHRIKSDECWHFYAGETLLVHVIDLKGEYRCICLGKNIHEGEVYQAVVPAGAWFASEPAPGSTFTLVGCTVSPGFDFADFEMANALTLAGQFPRHRALIQRLCR